MKAILEQTQVIKLELTGAEALWLKAVMQNPLHGQHPDVEDSEEKRMRHKFFQTITELEMM